MLLSSLALGTCLWSGVAGANDRVSHVSDAGRYLDHDTVVKLGGVGSYVDREGVAQAGTLAKIEERQARADRGYFLDHDSVVAAGGVGSYARGEREMAGQAAVEDTMDYVPEPQLIELNDSFHFDTGSSQLTPAAKDRIAEIADQIPADSQEMITIDGYSDATGSDEQNVELSRARAQRVKQELVLNGIPEEQILVKAWGSSKPVAGNDTVDGRAMNRRVEIGTS
jgi:outer membrane protein OmpA-like peptidoglycan-associated protein